MKSRLRKEVLFSLYKRYIYNIENNVEVSFPDFQSLLLALRYSGNSRRRTPARDELNPDNMTYEVHKKRRFLY